MEDLHRLPQGESFWKSSGSNGRLAGSLKEASKSHCLAYLVHVYVHMMSVAAQHLPWSEIIPTFSIPAAINIEGTPGSPAAAILSEWPLL